MESTDILERINNLGYTSTLDEINRILKNINQTEIKEVQIKRYKYEIWDKKSSINGISAADILKSKNYEIKEVYLIYIDENLIYMQDHDPNQSGFISMTKTQAKKIAEEFINKQVEINTEATILNLIINKLKRGENNG